MKTGLLKNILVGFIFFFLFGSGGVFAHAPKEVILAFDQKTKSLDVNIRHEVKNPEKHYIKSIRIFINGEKVLEKTYSSQKTTQGQTDVFGIENVKTGDEILVKATCSKFGGKRAKIKVS